ncbi:MAG: right-handed parallel beta-helix repeat-containing protein [Acidobacteriota bacterium]
MRNRQSVFLGLVCGGLTLLCSFTASALAAEFCIPCDEGALREALQKAAQAGGGRITFEPCGGILRITDTIKFVGNDVIIDGEDRNITVKYAGPDDCSQKEGQDRFIEIYGNRNVVRNLTLDHFPDGIHVQQGFDNVIENIRFPVVCEDAVTNSGMGFEAFRTIIRNCYFESSADKAVMINNGGSVTVENCEFVNCQQPVRAGGKSGRHTVRGCKFRGAKSTGPRFNGGQEGMVIVFENNTVEDAQFGIRIYGNVEAIVRNNSFQSRPSDGCSVYIFDNARVRFEGNTVQAGGKRGVLVQGFAKVDLGGGRVVVTGDSEPSRGLNIL